MVTLTLTWGSAKDKLGARIALPRHVPHMSILYQTSDNIEMLRPAKFVKDLYRN